MRALLMYSNFTPSATHCERLETLLGHGNVMVANSESSAVAQSKEAEMFLGHRYLRQSFPHAPLLKWVHATAAGVDHVVSAEFIRRSLLLTRSPIFSEVIAQHALALAWAILREIPAAARAQDRREWKRPERFLPLPRAAMVLGMGHIGRALGALLKRNGLRVFGVARSFRDETSSYCDVFMVGDEWRLRLGEVDLLFLCLPLTRATLRIVGASVLAALPAHAVVVNVGRGATLDSQAMIAALRAGRLGGAALDVVERKPLPPDDPLWGIPRLLITPHVAAYHPGLQPRLEKFVEEQVARYLSGETPLYSVSKQAMVEAFVEEQ